MVSFQSGSALHGGLNPWLYIVVHAADISDRDGVWDVIDGIHERYPPSTHIWVDGG